MEIIERGRASVMDPARPRQEQIEELRQAIKECYCGLGPACPVWGLMTPDERRACSLDKRAYGQLFWKHGVAG
jgi:hypothetical protein